MTVNLDTIFIMNVDGKRVAICNSIDVPHTNVYYAKAVFEIFNADEVILPFPYAGRESLEPFLAYGKPVYVSLINSDPTHLCWLKGEDGRYLWQMLWEKLTKDDS